MTGKHTCGNISYLNLDGRELRSCVLVECESSALSILDLVPAFCCSILTLKKLFSELLFDWDVLYESDSVKRKKSLGLTHLENLGRY